MPCNCRYDRGIANFGAELARARKQKIVEEAALDRDLAFIAGRKIDMCPLAANRDELDRFQFSMRRRAAEIGKLQPAQYRPARRIQTITTDFFSRECFPLVNECAQSSRRSC